MSSQALGPAETEVWHAWKRAAETIRARVGRDIFDKTGLSGADYGVLSRVADLGDGELRQQELAESMGWDKSRLSHHLSRMEARDLVERRGSGPVMIALTAQGKKTLRAARPVHAKAVRAHFLEKMSAAERTAFMAVLERFNAETEDAAASGE